MRINGHSYKVDYGHLALLAAIAVAVAWYVLDARSVSTSVNNLLLVQPASIFALILCLLILPQCFKRVGAEEEAAEAEGSAPSMTQLPTERSEVLKMWLLSAAFGAMIFLLDVVGFDVAIFLFCVASMVICGERRPHYLVGFSLAVTLAMIYGFRAIIPFPMPTAFL